MGVLDGQGMSAAGSLGVGWRKAGWAGVWGIGGYTRVLGGRNVSVTRVPYGLTHKAVHIIVRLNTKPVHMCCSRSWMDDLAAFKTGYDGMLLHLSVSEMQVRDAN